MIENQLYYSALNLFSIYIYDSTLRQILTDKARWYQLHFIINFITVIKISPYIINIILDPKK